MRAKKFIRRLRAVGHRLIDRPVMPSDRTTIVKTNARQFALGHITYDEYKARVFSRRPYIEDENHQLTRPVEAGWLVSK